MPETTTPTTVPVRPPFTGNESLEAICKYAAKALNDLAGRTALEGPLDIGGVRLVNGYWCLPVSDGARDFGASVELFHASQRSGIPVMVENVDQSPDDMRRFDVAAEMLRLLGVRSIELVTNNPDKISQLAAAGISIRRRIGLPSPANPYNVGYLHAKRDRTGHLIRTDDELAELPAAG